MSRAIGAQRVDPATEVRTIVEAACARIAPAWPLDRSIAVNPYWGWIDRPIAEAAANFGSVTGSSLTMPRAWYREQDAAGRLPDAIIERALERTGAPLSVADVRSALQAEAPAPTPFPTFTDTRDAMRRGTPSMQSVEVMLAQIGRVAENFVDQGAAAWSPDRSGGLYALWRRLARVDRSPLLLLELTTMGDAIGALSADAMSLITHALDTLPVPRSARETYLTALLYSVSGWASLAAQRRWDARRAGADDAMLVDLLAIRLAWELASHRAIDGTMVSLRWTHARAVWEKAAAALQDDQTVDWVLQEALETRYHEQLACALGAELPAHAFATGPSSLPTVRAQAVFCIDVRSEPMRRALEAVDSEVRTLGFAGFFGLPITYTTPDGATRQQLPGLLSPAWEVRDVASDGALAGTGSADGRYGEAWRSVMLGAPSTFTAVEATGLLGAAALVNGAFKPVPPVSGVPTPPSATAPAFRPVLVGKAGDEATSIADRAALAAGLLRGMSLTSGFARVVAFIGHGASLTNNPQAAALACGACGGHSGEVNARAAASLLNDPAVRDALVAEGIVVPAATRFLAGCHDTVTDAVTLFSDSPFPADRWNEIEALSHALLLAGNRCRSERAPALGLAERTPAELRDDVAHRAADWAQVRPEWGLARNGVFIAAPRSRTRDFDLRGRAFLHEYAWQRDTDFTVLETILTAPVIVAHWINLQYYASTVDPDRFGSGDKTLHNVAGGSAGVYEGAGGDLRIGLARQSLHDGTKWQHEPVRLGVYIEAPADAIDTVIARHDVVRHLVEHGWIHLHVIDVDGSGVRLRRRDQWETVHARRSTLAH
ncbi:MAG TPA: DUF2309 domain-containing protein [Gemmatimonas sp.]|nr:DUF2309 domain-containing protein [Gemmatimonas sp.]